MRVVWMPWYIVGKHRLVRMQHSVGNVLVIVVINAAIRENGVAVVVH